MPSIGYSNHRDLTGIALVTREGQRLMIDLPGMSSPDITTVHECRFYGGVKGIEHVTLVLHRTIPIKAPVDMQAIRRIGQRVQVHLPSMAEPWFGVIHSLTSTVHGVVEIELLPAIAPAQPTNPPSGGTMSSNLNTQQEARLEALNLTRAYLESQPFPPTRNAEKATTDLLAQADRVARWVLTGELGPQEMAEQAAKQVGDLHDALKGRFDEKIAGKLLFQMLNQQAQHAQRVNGR